MSAMPLPPAAARRFGQSPIFDLQPNERRLLADGQPVPLGARALDILLELVAHAGEPVSRQALIERVWGNVVVEENNLSVQINSLRKHLGAGYIATVPGFGYRFQAPMLDMPEAVAPAPPPRERLRTNLPATLTPLIGRDAELAIVGEMLSRHRMVTLLGAGGMGKTLLAQHLLRRRETLYRHGVCFVSLGASRDAAEVVRATAAALGVKADGPDPLAGLVATLAPMSMLVVLDNAEHLLATVAELAAAILDNTPDIHLVVTSQAPLRLAAERVHRLQALSVPGHAMSAAEAQSHGAVELFVDRARAADSRFVLDESNTEAAIALCRSLDGLPLAIELAAWRAPVLGVQRLAASMHERLSLLRNRNPVASDRQRTLRAALEWSHGLLAEAEQIVFRRLAVFAGSARLEWVVQVVADPPGQGALDRWAPSSTADPARSATVCSTRHGRWHASA